MTAPAARGHAAFAGDVVAPEVRAPRSRPTPVPTPAPSLLRRLAFPLWAYLASRVLVLACAVVSVTLVDSRPARGPWPSIGGPGVGLLQAFGRWDGAWYLEIARHGYRSISYGNSHHASQAFFPGYPAVVALVSAITRLPALASAVLVSTIFGGVATLVLWHMVIELEGRERAKRAIVLFCFSPGAIVLTMAYSEAMFITAAAASLYMLMRRRWTFAGMLGAVACITRPNGVALVATALVVAIVEIRRRREWRALAAPGLAALGTLTYAGFLVVHSGSALAWLDAESQGWHDRAAPISGFFFHAGRLPSTSLGTGGLSDLTWLLSIPVAVAAVWVLWWWRPPLPLLCYGVLATAMALCSYQVGARPRMLLSAFPVILAAGVRLPTRAYRAVLATSVVVLVALSVLTFGTLTTFP